MRFKIWLGGIRQAESVEISLVKVRGRDGAEKEYRKADIELGFSVVPVRDGKVVKDVTGCWHVLLGKNCGSPTIVECSMVTYMDRSGRSWTYDVPVDTVPFSEA